MYVFCMILMFKFLEFTTLATGGAMMVWLKRLEMN